MLDYSVSAQTNNLTEPTLYYPKLQYQGQMSTWPKEISSIIRPVMSKHVPCFASAGS